MEKTFKRYIVLLIAFRCAECCDVPLPDLKNGYFVRASFSADFNAFAVCLGGYRLLGPSFTTCSNDGTFWSDVGKCLPGPCGPPPPVENGNWVSVPDHPDPWASSLECAPGYALAGNLFMTCEGRQWSQPGVCIKLLERFPLDNFLVQNPPGSGEAQVFLQGPMAEIEDGPLPCDEPPDVIDGRYVLEDERNLNRLKIECNDLSKPSGRAVIDCNVRTGKWSQAGSCIRSNFQRPTGIQCGDPPRVPGGQGRVERLKNVSIPGSRARIVCNPSYSIKHGAKEIVCKINGEWSLPGRCILDAPIQQPCGAPPVIENGYLLDTNNVNSKTIQCFDFHKIQGSNITQCNEASRSWTVPGRCVRVGPCDVKGSRNSLELIGHIRRGNWSGFLEELVSKRANPNSKDSDGWTALMWAANNNKSAFAAELLKRCANVDATNEAKTSALMLATKARNVETVRMLLEKGANVSAQNIFGSSALLLAAQSCSDPVILRLLLGNSNISVSSSDNDGNTALHWTVRGNFSQCSDELITKNTSLLNRQNSVGLTALMIASKNGFLAIARSLLNAGADKTIEDLDGVSALQFAEDHGQDEIATLLKQSNAKATAQCCSNRRSSVQLVSAARLNDSALFRSELNNRADPNSRDAQGRTALMWAAENNNTEMFKTLLGCCVNLAIKGTADGFNGLMLAAKTGSSEMVDLMLNKDSSAGFINSLSRGGMTALAVAAQNGNVRVANLLMRRREANPEIEDFNDGNRALHWAVKGNFTNIVRDLINLKPNLSVNARNKRNESALMIAAKGGYLAIVRLLLETGRVDVSLRNNEGQTALQLAEDYGQVEAADIIDLFAAATTTTPPRRTTSGVRRSSRLPL